MDTCAVTPYGRHHLVHELLDELSDSCQASASSIRSVPDTRPDDGMTLLAPPAWIAPQTSAAPARGSSRRDSGPGRP